MELPCKKTEDKDGINSISFMMEVGIATSMGAQMAGMMNKYIHSITQTFQNPVQQSPPPIPNTLSYMLAIDGKLYGPYNIEQLKQMIINRQMTVQTLVWCHGMVAWEAAGSCQYLASLFVPPPIPLTSNNKQ